MHSMQPMQHMEPMQLHQMAPPAQPMQPMPYGFEGCAPEGAHGVLPPPPPVCLDMGNVEEKFEKTEEAAVEKPRASREPEPESDSNSRSEDEAVLLSFGAGEEQT